MSAMRPVAGRRAQATSRSTMAPVKGWNTRDALAAMEDGYAPQLDNFFPDDSGCNLRRGTLSWVTGLSGNVESLMSYSAPTASNLFGADAANIYDVSSTGAVGAAAVTGLSNGRWQWTNFGTGGANYLFCCNGADTPRKYNGSTWANFGFSGSGLTVTKLIHVNAFKQRLFFVEKDTLNVWYAASVSTISGTLNKLDFSDQAKLGGYMMAMLTWTIDGGAGADDLAVFLTSEGEAIVYQGTDPSDPEAWALRGVYRVGPPLSRRCFVNFGGDVLLINRDGLLPLSLALSEANKGNDAIAMSDVIAPSWKDAVRQYSGNYGWEVLLHATSQMLIVNVPLTSDGARADQYVMNTVTRRWCRFRNIAATCMVSHGNVLYFGTKSGKVYKADIGTGDDDNAIDIVGEGVTSFNYFGSTTRKKQVTMVRPMIKSDAPLSNIAIGVDVDFNIRIPSVVPSALTDTFATWDVAEWDVAEWAGYLKPQVGWLSARGIGISVALHIKTSSRLQAVNWVANDWLYMPGSSV